MPVRNAAHAPTALRILLVDDNAHGLSARKNVLEELGHRIVTATSGADALEQFSHQKFDLVVTDYKMPRMDGIELIARLRKSVPELPVILVSGYAETLGMSENGTGADAIIQKSNNEVSHLVRAVNRLVHRKPPVKKPATSEGKTAPRAKRKAT